MQRLLDPEPDRRPTAPQLRTLLAGIATTEPGAGDTVVDPEPAAGATTNLRSKSPAIGTATRQLTPAKLALAPTVTPQPRVITEPGISDAKAAPQPASPSLVELDQPPARRWPILVIGAGAIAAIALAVILATRGGDAQRPRAAVTSDAGSFAGPLDASLVGASLDAAPVAQPAMVTLKVTSEPSGASVQAGSQTKITPFELVVERGTLPIELIAKLAGRPPTTLMIVPDMDKPAVIKLRPRRATKPGPSDEATPF